MKFCASLLRFGVPEFVLNLEAPFETIAERLMKQEEKEPPITEEDTARIKEWEDKDKEYKTPILEYFDKNYAGRCKIIQLKTDESLESTTNKLQSLFNPKVILLNHEK